MALVWYDDAHKPIAANRDLVGGKGLNLFKLQVASEKLKSYRVPPFAILAHDERPNYSAIANRLKFPLIVRSSAPEEDGTRGTFAGMFKSIPNIKSLDELAHAVKLVRNSAGNADAHRYAKQLQIPLSHRMPTIIQEFVNYHPAVLSIGEFRGRAELTDPEGHTSAHAIDYKMLDEAQCDRIYTKPGALLPGEGDLYFHWDTARKIRKELGFNSDVQFEGGIIPGDALYFVQARQIPKNAKNPHILSKMKIDAPYLEAEVCNSVPGSLTLPGYVTVSHSFFPHLLSMHGVHSILTGAPARTERSLRFFNESKLNCNQDALLAMNICTMYDRVHSERAHHMYEQMWARGNELFSDYVLVCDKLDESQIGMARLTTNKRAIISCSDDRMNSHAMTVAQDLGIMCLGSLSAIRGTDTFYHKIQTGDMIHVESDGRHAFAYLEKARVKDPYAVDISVIG